MCLRLWGGTKDRGPLWTGPTILFIDTEEHLVTPVWVAVGEGAKVSWHFQASVHPLSLDTVRPPGLSFPSDTHLLSDSGQAHPLSGPQLPFLSRGVLAPDAPKAFLGLEVSPLWRVMDGMK